jgi:hypothetical protein
MAILPVRLAARNCRGPANSSIAISNDCVHELAGIINGRRMHEVMRYWDDDQPDWDAVERDFAAAWRAKPKWVVSRTLESVGPNATLVRDDAGAFVRALKAKLDG